MTKTKLLITGGAGFLGSHLVDRFVAEGFDVTVFDNLSRGLCTEGSFRFIKGDVNIAEDVDSLERYDIVVHCAALCGVETVIDSPEKIIDDFIGTYNLCKYIQAKNISRFIFFSSGEIYGSEAVNAEEEDDIVLWNTHQTRTNYALSKLMGESLTRSLDIPYIIIRPFNVFGPRQQGAGVVRNFFDWAMQGQTLQIYNSGSELRAMCYVDDFIEGCFQSIVKQDLSSKVYNIGNPFNTMTINRIAETTLKITGSTSSIAYIKKEYPDKKGVTPCIGLASRDFGYAPSISLENGLQRMMRIFEKLE